MFLLVAFFRFYDTKTCLNINWFVKYLLSSGKILVSIHSIWEYQWFYLSVNIFNVMLRDGVFKSRSVHIYYKKKNSHLPSVLSILIHHCKSFWFCLRSLRYLDLRFVLLPWYTVMVNVILFDIQSVDKWHLKNFHSNQDTFQINSTDHRKFCWLKTTIPMAVLIFTLSGIPELKLLTVKSMDCLH